MGGKTSTSGQGRPKGTPNKLTGDVKAMIIAALDKAGGVRYLHEQAQENPKAFLTLVGRVLPLQVDANHSGGVTVQIMRFTDAPPE